MTNDQRTAALLLDLVSRTSVAADDATLRNVLMARSWLHRIANGQLVTVPATPEPLPPVSAEPAPAMT